MVLDDQEYAVMSLVVMEYRIGCQVELLGKYLEAMEDDEVALMDGVFEGAFGALGDESLEVEALVDTMEVMVVDDE
ncbi:hypothetical protein Tco_1173570 [Tanacetum coccineum]